MKQGYRCPFLSLCPYPLSIFLCYHIKRKKENGHQKKSIHCASTEHRPPHENSSGKKEAERVRRRARRKRETNSNAMDKAACTILGVLKIWPGSKTCSLFLVYDSITFFVFKCCKGMNSGSGEYHTNGRPSRTKKRGDKKGEALQH